MNMLSFFEFLNDNPWLANISAMVGFCVGFVIIRGRNERRGYMLTINSMSLPQPRHQGLRQNVTQPRQTVLQRD